MRRLTLPLLAAAALGVVALAPAVAEAQTANFTVTASVARLCTISATNMTFGSYNPNAATAATATSAVTLTCSRGTPYSVGLTSATGFNMSNGAGSNLAYNLLQPDGTTVWDGATQYSGTAASRAPFNLTVNGSIGPGQDVPVGTYTDTVVATVTF